MASIKFKIPKPGEGTRERKPSKYGEGGRAVGGNARQNAFKVSKPDRPRHTNMPPSTDDIPVPGGHPTNLKQRAKANGYEGEDSPFARLAALAGKPGSAPDLADEFAPESLDGLFGSKVAEERPERDLAAERAEIVQKAKRFPILRRPLKLINAGTRDAKSAGEIPPADGGANRGVAADDAALDGGRDGEREGVLRGDGASDGASAEGEARRVGGEGDGAEARVAADEQKEANGVAQHAADGGARGGAGGRSVPGGDGGGPTGDDRGAALTRASEASTAASVIAAEVEASFATDYSEEQEVDLYRAMALPGVVCNSCSLQERCPRMQPNATCAFTEDMQGLTTRDIRNVLPRLEMLADLQAERALRGALAERVMGGGTLDPAVSRQIEIAAAAAERVARIKAAERGTQTLTVVAQGPGVLGKGGGILSKLMAGIGAPQTGQGELVLNPVEEPSDGKVHLPQLVEAPKVEPEKLTVTMTSSPADLPPRIA